MLLRASCSRMPSCRKSPCPSVHSHCVGSNSTRFPPDPPDLLRLRRYSRSHARRRSAAGSRLGAAAIPATKACVTTRAATFGMQPAVINSSTHFAMSSSIFFRLRFAPQACPWQLVKVQSEGHRTTSPCKQRLVRALRDRHGSWSQAVASDRRRARVRPSLAPTSRGCLAPRRSCPSRLSDRDCTGSGPTVVLCRACRRGHTHRRAP